MNKRKSTHCSWVTGPSFLEVLSSSSLPSDASALVPLAAWPALLAQGAVAHSYMNSLKQASASTAAMQARLPAHS